MGRGSEFADEALARGAAATLVPHDAFAALARLGQAVRELSSGRVVGITGSMGGKSLQRKPLLIRQGEPVPDDRVEVTTRIGITRCADWPLRWIVRGNRFVSRGKVSG